MNWLSFRSPLIGMFFRRTSSRSPGRAGREQSGPAAGGTGAVREPLPGRAMLAQALIALGPASPVMQISPQQVARAIVQPSLAGRE